MVQSRSLSAAAVWSAPPANAHMGPAALVSAGRPLQAIAAARSPGEKRLKMPDLRSDSCEKREAGRDDRVETLCV